MALVFKEGERSLLCPFSTGRGHTWWEENLPSMKGHNTNITANCRHGLTHDMLFFLSEEAY